MTENGSVFFLGTTDNPDPSQDAGYFHNDPMLLREGVASVDGMTTTSLGSSPSAFSMSSNGRYVVALVTNAASEDVPVLLDLGLVQVMSSVTIAARGTEPGQPLLFFYMLRSVLNHVRDPAHFATCKKKEGALSGLGIPPATLAGTP